jgi:hypothetical protein
VKGPDKQIQIVFAKNRRFLIALYFSHLFVFSYKNLTLCRESLMFLEYPKKNSKLSVHSEASKRYKIVNL